MNNLKYTDFLKEPRKTEPIKKTELLNIPRAVSFVPPNYIGALDADGNLGGERTVSNTTTNTTQPTYREALNVKNLNGTVAAVNKDGNVGGVRPGIPLLEKGGTGSGVVEGNPPTDGSGNTGGGTDGGGSVNGGETKDMSYEQYILSLKSKADDTYKRSIINAQNTYDHSRSAYGEHAAALGNMGLTGSGYSQYLDSKAYAQRSADMNAAGAVRADAYAKADAQYMDYLNQKETEAKNEALQKETNAKKAYMSIYEALAKDASSYSTADIDRIGAEMGLTPEQISGLKDVKNEKILSSNTYKKDDLLEMFGSEDDPRYQEYFKKIQDEADSIDASWFYDEEGNLTPKAKNQSLIDELKNAGANVDKAQELLDKIYAAESILSNGVTFKRDTGWDGQEVGQMGNNIVLEDGDGNKYRVEFSGLTASDEVKGYAEAKGLKENDVFMYDNKVYVIVNGKYYEVRKRENSTGAWANSWNNLVKRLKTKPKE